MSKMDLFILKLVAGIVGGVVIVGGAFIVFKTIEAACLVSLTQVLSTTI